MTTAELGECRLCSHTAVLVLSLKSKRPLCVSNLPSPLLYSVTLSDLYILKHLSYRMFSNSIFMFPFSKVGRVEKNVHNVTNYKVPDIC